MNILKKLIQSIIRFFNIPSGILEKWKWDALKYIKGDLVDIGCGKKQKEYLPYVNKYTGVDYPTTAEVIKPLNGDLEIDVFASADDLPFPDASFDTALSYQVLEHLQNPLAAVKEAYRILKKDGHYIVTVPFIHRIHYQPYDYFRYTRYGLEFLLKSAGFEIVKFERGGGMWLTIGARIAGYFFTDLMGLGQDNKKGNPLRLLWAPLAVPMILITVPLFRLLEFIHHVDTDSYYYFIVGKKTKN